MGDDNIDARPDKLGSELRGAVASRIRIAKLDRDVLAFRVAESAQPAPEGIGEWMRRRCGYQHADKGQSLLLCTRRQRPRRRRAPEQRDCTAARF
jgi:hypothetical protein